MCVALVAIAGRRYTYTVCTYLPCAGHEHDVTMDDELDEGHFDGSDDTGSGDEMDF